MAIDSVYWETTDGMDMDADDVAALLIKLYADYQHYYGSENNDYAKAVGIAVRMLTD